MDAQPLAWWMWIALGLLFAVAELLTPGIFFLIFFGVGGITAGLATALVPMPFVAQGLVFVAVSIASLLLFRRRLMRRFGNLRPNLPVDTLVGETVLTMEEIPAAGQGKAEFRGTTWTAQNVDADPIPRHRRCRVEGIDGLTLMIRSL